MGACLQRAVRAPQPESMRKPVCCDAVNLYSHTCRLGGMMTGVGEPAPMLLRSFRSAWPVSGEGWMPSTLKPTTLDAGCLPVSIRANPFALSVAQCSKRGYQCANASTGRAARICAVPPRSLEAKAGPLLALPCSVLTTCTAEGV